MEQRLPSPQDSCLRHLKRRSYPLMKLELQKLEQPLGGSQGFSVSLYCPPGGQASVGPPKVCRVDSPEAHHGPRGGLSPSSTTVLNGSHCSHCPVCARSSICASGRHTHPLLVQMEHLRTRCQFVQVGTCTGACSRPGSRRSPGSWGPLT